MPVPWLLDTASAYDSNRAVLKLTLLAAMGL